MPIVATLAACAAMIWGFVYARRGSLLIGCATLVAVHYVLGHWFWSAHIGPIPLTIDRVLVIGLAGVFVLQSTLGRLEPKPLCGSDWLLLFLLVVLSISAVLGYRDHNGEDSTAGIWRLIASFIIPAVVYWFVRQSRLDFAGWKAFLAVLPALGAYLACTGLAEISGLWWAVFPRYIADPTLGTHFGRARGPILNSASLGLCLTVCIWAAWTLFPYVKRIWQLAIVVAIPLMAATVFFSFTRSTWLGLAASGMVMLALTLPAKFRWPVLGAASMAGLLLAAVVWSSVVGLDREGSASDSKHSVHQRKAFTYVSTKMFADHPVMGVGLGRFYDKKLPYLADRSQTFELESIRNLEHHNTFLSILVETGMIGLAGFVAVLVAWARAAWQISRNFAMPRWVRAQGTLMLTLLTAYLPTLVFHDVTHLPTEFLTLFALAGFTVGLRQNQSLFPLTEEAGLDAISSTRSEKSSPVAIRKKLFGIEIDPLSLSSASRQVLDWCHQPLEAACKYVVTPNVDHVVKFQHHAKLRSAYETASLVLADGAPVVLASKLLGNDLPERVAGSDLVPALFDRQRELAAGGNCKPLRVFLLGAAPGVANKAAENIESRWQGVEVVGTYSPPLGFETNALENFKILDLIAQASPDLLVVGLGAPKQELWVRAHYRQIQAKVALCVGATIDFLAGHRQRSPIWMQRMGLEWLHRLVSEPKRLAARYAHDAWVFPQLCWKEFIRVHG